MKIKLHNSLSRMERSIHDGDHRYLFDNKIVTGLRRNNLYLRYKMDDISNFLKFSVKTKKFKKPLGFGNNEKNINPDWWKNPKWKWKEISE